MAFANRHHTFSSRKLKHAARLFSTGWKGGRTARPAFTLVELLVVISIIIVLLGAVIVAAPKLINSGKTQSTQFMLTAVRDAVEEFKREQTEKPTLTRPARPMGNPASNYRRRYAAYPPDELEVFGPGFGIFGTPAPASLAPGQAIIQPPPMGPAGKYSQPLSFYFPLPPGDVPEFRDNLALTLAIDLFGQSSKMMLEQIAASNRREVPTDGSGNPSVYLNVDGNSGYQAAGDKVPYYLVDGWGMPIGYMAQRDFQANRVMALESGNHALWNAASTAMVQRNGGQPVIVSYGADGEDQLSRDVQTIDPRANLVGDWMDGGNIVPDMASTGFIDHPLNRDNVYPDPIVKQRLEAAP